MSGVDSHNPARARAFWSQDNTGRDTCIAIALDGDPDGAVWDAVRRARNFVIEREHDEHRYKGRFIRGWSEDDGFFWTESPDA